VVERAIGLAMSGQGLRETDFTVLPPEPAPDPGPASSSTSAQTMNRK